MTVAHDVYSETNPAFCTFVLVAFTAAYLSINNHGPEVPTSYLALPIALSGDLDNAFARTNRNTGLLEWLERSPQVQVGLTERVNGSMSIVTEAIRFACFTRVLVVNEHARLQLGGTRLKKNAVKALSDESGRSIKRAERLGYWFAMAGSTRTVFDIMGLTV